MLKYSFAVLLCVLVSNAAVLAQSAKPVAPDPLLDSVKHYQSIGNFQKAVPFAQSVLLKAEKEKGPESPEAIYAMNLVGDLCYRIGNLEEAEKMMVRCLEVCTRINGPTDLTTGATHHNLGNLYTNLGQANKAEHHFKEALAARKASLGSEHADVAATTSSLAVLYMNLGQYKESEELAQEALAIRRKILGEECKETGASYNNLGNLYWQSGNLPKAEEYHEKGLKIRQKVLGPEHPDVAHSFNNLGLVYVYMGNLPKAETYLLKALEIKEKLLGKDNLEVAASYNNLGNLNKDMGRYSEAIRYGKRCLEIGEKILGPDHPNVGGYYNNLCNLHLALGNLFLAEKYGKKGVDIWINSYGPDYYEVAGGYLNLSNLYANQGKPEKASLFNEKAISLRRKLFGDEHPDMTIPYQNEAANLRTRGQMAKAETYFNKAKQLSLEQVRQFFPAFSDEEKEAFYTTLKPNSDEFQAFAVQRYAANQAIAGQLYNHQLATKSLLMNSSAKWKHRIKSSGDKKLFLRFTVWESLQNKLAGLLQSTDSVERLAIDSVKAMSEQLEKELSLRSENFAQLADRHQTTWQEVQKQLGPGEAAVEIIRTRRYGIERTFTDTSDPAKPTYRVTGLSDSSQYVALILKPGIKMPELVVLHNGNELEGKYLHYYQNCIDQQLEDKQSYRQFWQKIGTKLGTCKRVYISPDGVYLNLNLNILQNPRTGKYLLDELDIRLVTVTRDLIPTKTEPLNKLACLVGFPSYYKDHEETISALGTERKSPTLQYGMKLEAGEALAQLPQTKTEVTRISDLLTGLGWEVKRYLADDAIEENLKESYKPRLLHIATHGYFMGQGDNESNPLLRSGLMLAGAGTTLTKGKPDDAEDGILTAYEAMNLNLDNTDLVVLSACETGLGEIKNGEGVYGLQRAFKVAGARTLIMSLWKVNDQTTQELMVSFYKHWASPPSPLQRRGEKAPFGGLGAKRSAFLAAQKELKAKYPHPYYWGAFVMVGE